MTTIDSNGTDTDNDIQCDHVGQLFTGLHLPPKMDCCLLLTHNVVFDTW